VTGFKSVQNVLALTDRITTHSSRISIKLFFSVAWPNGRVFHQPVWSETDRGHATQKSLSEQVDRLCRRFEVSQTRSD